MTVSAVIPLYNKARHIRRSIDSARAQTRPPDEIVVVDDGSTDGSAQIVAEIRDPRIRLVRQANGGVSAARNRGVQEASGDLIAFLDADDEWLPTFLETVLSLQVRNPLAGIYATAYRFCEGTKIWRPAHVHCPDDPQGGLLEDYFLAMSGPPPFCSSSVMVPRRILNEVGHFPMGMARGEDLFTWAKIALRHRVAWSPAEGAVYHLSADNRSGLGALVAPDIPMVDALEELLQDGEEPISARAHVEEYLAAIRLAHARACYLRGEKDWALAQLERTKGTKLHRMQRMGLLSIVWIPPGICKSILSIKSVPGRIVKNLSTAGRK